MNQVEVLIPRAVQVTRKLKLRYVLEMKIRKKIPKILKENELFVPN